MSKKFTDEECFDALRRAAESATGHLMIRHYEEASSPEDPSRSYLIRRFGSWTAALLAAGLPTKHQSAGRVISKAEAQKAYAEFLKGGNLSSIAKKYTTTTTSINSAFLKHGMDTGAREKRSSVDEKSNGTKSRQKSAYIDRLIVDLVKSGVSPSDSEAVKANLKNVPSFEIDYVVKIIQTRYKEFEDKDVADRSKRAAWHAGIAYADYCRESGIWPTFDHFLKYLDIRTPYSPSALSSGLKEAGLDLHTVYLYCMKKKNLIR